MPKFVPRERKHKVRQRNERNGDSKDEAVAAANSNAVEILPSSVSEREQKRQDIKAHLRSQQPRANGRKQKRLDKYIVGDCVPSKYFAFVFMSQHIH